MLSPKYIIFVAILLVAAISTYAILQPQPEVLDVPSGNNKLAIELYKQMSNSTGNFFFSPPAVYVALSALYDGAKGDAAAQIQKLLSLETDRNKRHEAISRFIADVYRDDPNVRPEMASALWLPNGVDSRDAYEKSVGDAYGMDVGPADQESVNAWLEEKTRIWEPSAYELRADRATVTSVASFEGTWWAQFFPPKKSYYLDDDGRTTYPSMGVRYVFDYANVSNVELTKFPYEGERLSMLVIFPKKGEFGYLEKSLTVEKIEKWKAAMRSVDGSTGLYELVIESNYNFKEPLENLGVTDIFYPDVDLSEISTDGHNLHISNMTQTTFIHMTPSGTQDPPVQTRMIFRDDVPDHHSPPRIPFIFTIQDDATGAILFMGRVVGPPT